MKKSFSITPRVLSHFGEDLIKNESIALLELVKNSYDACATKCTVYFKTSNDKVNTIIVEDDGYGMTKDLIVNVWLTVGTDYKLFNKKKNKFKRSPLGEKGVGRLGVHKLGNKITLISKSKSSSEVILKIDWSKLINAKTLSEFEVDVVEQKIPTYFRSNEGTKIIIEDLKTIWDKIQLREVYRNLMSLNSPFSNTDDMFEVKVESNSDTFEGLPDFEEIKNSALYFGHCKISKNKIIEFNYEFKPWEELSKIDKGRKVRLHDITKEDLIIRRVDKKNNIPIDLDKYKIGDIEFDLIIFEMDSQILSYHNTEKSTLQKYLRENGGVRVYRDGVRVYDYGERDNDWLGIDLKRVHRVGGNVSNNIIIGSVRLNRNASVGLREKTNREGFIEDGAYKTFTEAVDYVLSLIVRERNIDKEILSSLYAKNKTVEPVLSDLNEAIQYAEANIKNANDKEVILKYLYRINDQYSQVKEILIKSANAGLNLSVVIHEIEKLISALIDSIRKNKKNNAINISLSLEKIIRGYSAMIKKTDIKKTVLSKIAQLAISNYEFRYLDHNIKVVSNYAESSLEAYLSEAEAISVIANLLDNSIYWLSYKNKNDKMISVFITDQIKGYNSIVISDNGPGFNIPTEIAIKPFITGKPHNIGSGLGLHVATEMMRAMKGKILFLDRQEINLPQNIINKNADKSVIALCFPKNK